MTKVSPSEWAAPSHLSQGDKDFLEDCAEMMWGIVSSSYLALGQILLKVKNKFRRDPELNGWFTRWVDEVTPLSIKQVEVLTKIAEEAINDAEFGELTKTVNKTIMVEVAKLPAKYKDKVKDVLKEGHSVSRDDIREFSSHPYVEAERLEELILKFQADLVSLKVKGITAKDDKEKDKYSKEARRTDERLLKALSELRDVKDKCTELEKQQVTQEMLVNVLRKEIKNRQLKIEELQADFYAEKQRAVARLQIDLNRALDGVLATFDRYTITKEEMPEDVAKKLQDKMDLIHAKLRSASRT